MDDYLLIENKGALQFHEHHEQRTGMPLSPLAPKDYLALMVCANCFSEIDLHPSFIYQ